MVTNIIPPSQSAPSPKWSHRELVRTLNAYAAGNQKLAALLQRQDVIQRYVAHETATLLATLTDGIVMPWHKHTIETLEKVIRIIAGQEPIPTMTIPCHSCGVMMEVPNLGPQPKDAVALCADCAELVNRAAQALSQQPESRQQAILAKYGIEAPRQLASLLQPTLNTIINKECTP